MRNLPPALRVYLGLCVFSVAGAIGTRQMGVSAPIVGNIASILLILSGIAVIAGPMRPRISLLWVGIGGTIVELVGVFTDRPFGWYLYTDAWQPVVQFPPFGARVYPVNFPLVVPFAWALLAGACAFVVPARWPEPLAAPLAGAILALVDLVMEPAITSRAGYWQWYTEGPLPGGAPYRNLVSWFVMGYLAALWLRLTVRERPSPLACGAVLVGFLAVIGAI